MHSYDKTQPDMKYVEKVNPYIHQLLGRGVNFETDIEGKSVLLSYLGRIVIGSIFKTTLERWFFY